MTVPDPHKSLCTFAQTANDMQLEQQEMTITTTTTTTTGCNKKQ